MPKKNSLIFALMKGLFFILILVIVSSFFLPDRAAACDTGGHDAEMACCETGLHGKQPTDYISCAIHLPDKAAGQHHGPCDGGCSSTGCHCPVTALSLTLLQGNKHDLPLVNFKSHLPFYTAPGISSGYLSIWRPPKID